jgi:hypothetical protein
MSEDVTNQNRPNEGKGRRGFLGEAGLAGMAALFAAQLAGADTPSTPGAAKKVRLKDVKDVRIITEESYEIPGGTEYVYEWEAEDSRATVARFRVIGSRIDHGRNYTMFSDTSVRLVSAEPGQAESGERTIIHGTKGDEKGNLRMDKVTVTTIYPDGTHNRLSRTVPVRTDLAETVKSLNLEASFRMAAAAKPHRPAPGEKG